MEVDQDQFLYGRNVDLPVAGDLSLRLRQGLRQGLCVWTNAGAQERTPGRGAKHLLQTDRCCCFQPGVQSRPPFFYSTLPRFFYFYYIFWVYLFSSLLPSWRLYISKPSLTHFGTSPYRVAHH